MNGQRLGIVPVLLLVAFFSWLAPASLQAAEEVLVKDPVDLLDGLEKRRKELDERAKWVTMRETELEQLEKRLSNRIKQLEALRDAIRKDLEQEKNIDGKNIARLAKIYTGMKPKLAAAALEKMDQPTVIKVFKVMRERVAAKILGKMDKRTAVRLSNELGMPIAEKRRRR